MKRVRPPYKYKGEWVYPKRKMTQYIPSKWVFITLGVLGTAGYYILTR